MTLRPVSYTHLDVYKRQELSHRYAADQRHQRARQAHARIHQVIDKARDRIGYTAEAVSYTHLVSMRAVAWAGCVM